MFSKQLAVAKEELAEFRKKEAADLLNEFVFQVKSKFTEPDDLPSQDCTGTVFDIDSKIIRQV